MCRPEKGGSNGPTPRGTPRGLGSTWGSAAPPSHTPKGSTTTVKTALQDMKQVWAAETLMRRPFRALLITMVA